MVCRSGKKGTDLFITAAYFCESFSLAQDLENKSVPFVPCSFVLSFAR